MSEELTSGQKSHYTRLINDFKRQSESLIEQLTSYVSKAETLEAELFQDSEESDSLSTKIKDIEQKLEKHLELCTDKVVEIDEVYDRIFTTTPTSESIVDSIDSRFEHISETEEEVNSIRDDLESVYKKIFGSEDVNGEKTKSLDDILEQKMLKIDSFHDNQEDKSEKLFKKIDSLLAGATSVELSKAFADKRKSFWVSNIIWTSIFIFSICCMLYISYTKFMPIHNVEEAGMVLATKLPLFLPLIWLALFASKQQSQNKRLEQEYSHKETLAKSFEGYKRQINDMETAESINILSELMKSVIVAINFNPSSTLSGKEHNDKSPIEGILEKFTPFRKTTKKNVKS